MKILQIVQNNPNTLDSSLPLLWHIRNKIPESKISILYCVTNKSQVLRKNHFVDNFCNQNGIKQIDLSRLLIINKFTRNFLKAFFKYSKLDNFSIKNILNDPISFFLNKEFLFVGMGFRYSLEKKIIERFVDFDKLDIIIKPDLIFFDLRYKSEFIARKKLFEFLYQRKITTIFIPHAPHTISPTADVTPFDKNKSYFPEFAKYWIPFKYSKAYLKFKNRKNDFINMGYPAFDSKWISHLKNSYKKTSQNKITCLVLLRNFYPKGEDIQNSTFIVNYDSNLKLIKRIKKALDENKVNYKLIFKPHPKASHPRVKNLLKECDLNDYIITYEPFFHTLPKTDLVISNFSTSLLMPIFFDIPTILLEDEVQFIINEWEVLKKMYQNLSFYCKENDKLSRLVKKALSSNFKSVDKYFLSKYYSDKQLERNLILLQNLISEKNK